MDAESFFVPSFLRAIKENTEASFRSIMAEPCKGVYTFEMLQPQFCKKLMSEVSHFFPFLSCIYIIFICSILVFYVLIKFWLLRWIILKDGSMVPNSESCDLMQWIKINMVLFLMILPLKPCLTDLCVISYNLYLEVIFYFSYWEWIRKLWLWWRT